MRHFILLVWVAIVGCNKQDKEALGRIGNKLSAKVSASDLRAKGLPLSGLREKVAERLASDKRLVDTQLEVLANGTEIELKGTASEEQKRRAFELAESTVGVERVVNSIQVSP